MSGFGSTTWKSPGGRARRWAALAVAATLLTMVAAPPAAAGALPKSKATRASTFEDNGDIGKAYSYGPILHGPWRLRSTIGDGPHGSGGSGSGDYDFYRITGLNEGWILSVDITADDLATGLDPVVVIYDSAGTVLGSNDDFLFCCDSFVEVVLPADGDYLIDVHSYFSNGLDVLTDPFDSSTGPGTSTEGDYELTIAVHAIHP